jgi:hypothetical protein
MYAWDPKAIADATSRTPAPIPSPAVIELTARIQPINPVIRGPQVADLFNISRLLPFVYYKRIEGYSPSEAEFTWYRTPVKIYKNGNIIFSNHW